MPRQATRQDLADRLREAQTEAGLHNEELARKLGVSVRLLQKWRAGSVVPRPENVKRLGRALNQPISYFYEQAA